MVPKSRTPPSGDDPGVGAAPGSTAERGGREGFGVDGRIEFAAPRSVPINRRGFFCGVTNMPREKSKEGLGPSSTGTSYGLVDGTPSSSITLGFRGGRIGVPATSYLIFCSEILDRGSLYGTTSLSSSRTGVRVCRGGAIVLLRFGVAKT